MEWLCVGVVRPEAKKRREKHQRDEHRTKAGERHGEGRLRLFARGSDGQGFSVQAIDSGGVCERLNS